MIKKYPWHFIYLIFIIISLTNIMQKLRWISLTDNIVWELTEIEKNNTRLVCKDSPKGSYIKKGDILYNINLYPIKNHIDLKRVTHKLNSNKKTARYTVERNELDKIQMIDINRKYTPSYYYLMVFPGIIFVLLTLNILNINLKQADVIKIPRIFHLLTLSFSSILVLSPTNSYLLIDFVILFFDRIAFLFFPAFLLFFALYYPIKSPILRFFNQQILQKIIFIIPTILFLFYIYYILDSYLSSTPEAISLIINKFRNVFTDYFSIYISLSIIIILISATYFIIRTKRYKASLLLFSLILGLSAFLILNIYFMNILNYSFALLTFLIFLLPFIPIGFAYYIGINKITIINKIIQKTTGLASIFLFVFGIYFFLGANIEQNKVVGIFWSIIAILTAGLIFKPIEGTIQNGIEKIFSRGSYNFKIQLTELITSIRTEKNLVALSKSILDAINKGFKVKHSSLIVFHKKNTFHSFPSNKRVSISDKFIRDLSESISPLMLTKDQFKQIYPKDSTKNRLGDCNQFFPLISNNNLIGLIALGLKDDNDFLSSYEWDLIYNISSSLTISVENALLYSQLQNQIKEINLLKEFNENIIENLNFGVIVISRLNIIRAWNKFMEKKFITLRKDVINKKALSIFGGEAWKKISSGKKERSATLNNINISINKIELIFDIHISSLIDNNNKNIGSILVFEDRTEKNLILNQLITTEKMASIGLLSAGIAHEINTPLTGISSYCQIILDEPENEENISLVSKIQEQVIRANKITRTLLDFSRQKGEVPVELNINNIIEESIALIDHKLKKKNILIKKDLDANSLFYGFPTRLQQMIINLLINASDSVQNENGIITVSTIETIKNIIINIKDNGSGIDKDNIKKIFEPFFTTKEKGQGTGLGLSIIYNIIREHYGDIKVNSIKDVETVFSITFPKISPLRRIKL